MFGKKMEMESCEEFQEESSRFELLESKTICFQQTVWLVWETFNSFSNT